MLFVYLCGAAWIEQLQCHYGQQAGNAWLDFAVSFGALFCLFVLGPNPLAVFGWVAWLVTDTCSWVFCDEPFCKKFVSLLDVYAGIRDYPFFCLIGFGLVVSSLAIVYIPLKRPPWFGVRVPLCAFVLVCQCLLLLGYSWISRIEEGYSPYGRQTLFTSQGVARIRAYFESPRVAAVRKDKVRKNLIVIIGESLEQQVLGEFSPVFSQSMPYLSGLSRKGLFAWNWTMVRNTDWSVAGIFASQCGLPMVVPQFPYYQMADRAEVMFKNQTSFKCVGDYLADLGYKGVYFYTTLAYFGGLQHLFVSHGLGRGFDKGSTGISTDWKLMRKLETEIERLVQEQPFYLLIGFCDTHPPYVEDGCKARAAANNQTKGLRVFDCLDQRIEATLKLLREHGVNETNSVVVIQGDHTLRWSAEAFTKGNRFERHMFALFPFEKPQRVDKRILHFDIAPTILDLLDIEYSPRFPYGRSIREQEESQLPTEQEYNYLLGMFNLAR